MGWDGGRGGGGYRASLRLIGVWQRSSIYSIRVSYKGIYAYRRIDLFGRERRGGEEHPLDHVQRQHAQEVRHAARVVRQPHLGPHHVHVHAHAMSMSMSMSHVHVHVPCPMCMRMRMACAVATVTAILTMAILTTGHTYYGYTDYGHTYYGVTLAGVIAKLTSGVPT
jgi:hypothetical protein